MEQEALTHGLPGRELRCGQREWGDRLGPRIGMWTGERGLIL